MNQRMVSIIALIMTLAGGILYVSMMPKTISAHEFKSIVEESDKNSASSWYLYLDAKVKYCLKLTTAFLPRRYCVSKAQLRIGNGEGGESVIGYVRENEFYLIVHNNGEVFEESF